MNDELGQVKAEIAATKIKLAKAEEDGDISRRNLLEEMLLELQKEKNRLSQPAGKIMYKFPLTAVIFSTHFVVTYGNLLVTLCKEARVMSSLLCACIQPSYFR